jgi:hypothetical protein
MLVTRRKNSLGELYSFELNSQGISHTGIIQILSQLEEVEIASSPKHNTHNCCCIFNYQDYTFEVIAPTIDKFSYQFLAPDNASQQLELLAKHFERSRVHKSSDYAQYLFAALITLVSALIATTVLTWLKN